jgi:halimadienyl-diphosphate synthase
MESGPSRGNGVVEGRIEELLIGELQSLLSQTGQGGGLMSPSVYDSAQVLRTLFPEDNGSSPVVDWLLNQQHADGGWGDPVKPLHRDVPSLSAILALRRFPRHPRTREACEAGLCFLRAQAPHWATLREEELPVAAEILLPSLLTQLGLEEQQLPRAPYAPLMALGERKRKIIAKLPVMPGVPWLHVWETWGGEPTANLMDGAGSIGHSPSATAAWVKAAAGRPELAPFVERGRKYLRESSLATGTAIPGLMPVGGPHNYFEQSFVLYALLMGGVLEDPRLESHVRPVLGELTRALGPQGIGMSDHFLQDGDDTSAVVAIMHALGLPVDPAVLYRFQRDDHFIAYPGEMHSSPTLTARCIHALRLLGKTDELAPFQHYLLNRQEPTGRWSFDKWSRSWLYTTFHSVVGLVGSPHMAAVLRALDSVLSAQLPDGGWSSDGRANMTETAYAVLMLGFLERHGVLHHGIAPALDRASRWMLQHYTPFAPPESKVKCWISKELYRMERVDTAFELCALLMMQRRA